MIWRPLRYALTAAGLAAVLAATPAAIQQATAQQAAAPSAAPSATARAFAAFLGQASSVCLREAARRCVEAGWRFADRDRDARVSPAELEAVRAELREWLAWPGNGIRPQEKRGVLIGLIAQVAVRIADLNVD